MKKSTLYTKRHRFDAFSFARKERQRTETEGEISSEFLTKSVLAVYLFRSVSKSRNRKFLRIPRLSIFYTWLNLCVALLEVESSGWGVCLYGKNWSWRNCRFIEKCIFFLFWLFWCYFEIDNFIGFWVFPFFALWSPIYRIL